MRPSTRGSPTSSPHATIPYQNPLHATEPPCQAAMPSHVPTRPQHTPRPTPTKVDHLGRQKQPQADIPIAIGQDPFNSQRMAGTQDRHGGSGPGRGGPMDRNHTIIHRTSNKRKESQRLEDTVGIPKAKPQLHRIFPPPTRRPATEHQPPVSLHHVATPYRPWILQLLPR